jgi:tripartite-type tricarboxylate transporter receptor subunit TctC
LGADGHTLFPFKKFLGHIGLHKAGSDRIDKDIMRGQGLRQDFRELIDNAKRNPGKVRIGTAGSGSVGDFCVEMINSLTGAGLVSVPFKGAAPAVAALRGGHIEGVVLALGALSAHLRSGAMRGMAISTRFPEFPGIPTLAELGYKQNLLGIWLAFFAPAGIPAEATRALVPAVERAVENPATAAKLAKLGIVLSYAPPEQVIAEIREEHRVVNEIARRAGLVK